MKKIPKIKIKSLVTSDERKIKKVINDNNGGYTWVGKN